MSHGIVVDHKESNIRYAISEGNFNEKVHDRVRDLKPGETVLGYQPRPKESLADLADPNPTLWDSGEPSDLSATGTETPAKPTKPLRTNAHEDK